MQLKNKLGLIILFAATVIIISLTLSENLAKQPDNKTNILTGNVVHPVYSGFALPINTFSQIPNIAFTTLNEQRTITISTNDDVIYKTAYLSTNGRTWTPITLTGISYHSSSNWINASATGTINVNPNTFNLTTTKTLSTKNYIITYTCTKTNTWDCHSNMWQIKQFNTTLNITQAIQTNATQQGTQTNTTQSGTQTNTEQTTTPNTTCNSGYANCDNNNLNGCETTLGTNEHCSSCSACLSGQTCANKICVNNANTTYFQSGFERVTLTGTHFNNEWTILEAKPKIDWVALAYNGASTYAHGELTADPENTSNRVLFAEVHDDDPSVSGFSRFQLPIKLYPNEFNTFKISYDVYWNPDIENIQGTSQSMPWFNLIEFWEAYNSSLGGNTNGQATWILRWSYSGSGTIKWRLSAIKQQPIADVNMYNDRYNSAVPIPFGEWANLEFTFIRGQANTGRMIVKITPRSTGVTSTIFDVTDYTEYPQTEQNPSYIWQFHLCKLYSSDTTYDYFRSKGWEISAYYDNFKLVLE